MCTDIHLESVYFADIIAEMVCCTDMHVDTVHCTDMKRRYVVLPFK